MPRVALALLLTAVGCASPTDTKIQPRLDFSVEADDLSMPDSAHADLTTTAPSDLAAPDAGADDLAMASLDLSMDLRTPADLRLVDLRPPVCDLAGGAANRLWFAGVAAGNDPLVARFHPSSGWQLVTIQTPHKVAEISLALLNGQPLLAQKGNDGNHDVESSFYDPCADAFPEPAQIFAASTTLNRPALLASTAADLIFRGQVANDQRLYHSHSGGGMSWSAPVAQNNFLSTLNPAVAVYRGGVHALFTGTNHDLYDGLVLDSGSGGTATEIGADGVQVSNQPPAAIVDGNGRMVVVWTQTDKNLEWFAREPDGSTTVGPQLLCGSCFFGGPLAPALALDASGHVVVAWSGDTNDKKVYTSTLSGTTWGAATLASGSCGTGDCQSTLPPSLATGLGGDDLELVFIRDSDGKASHARMVAGVWQQPAAFTTTNFLTQPALGTSQ